MASKAYGWLLKEADLEAHSGKHGSGWQHADREDNKCEQDLDCRVDYCRKF